MTKVLHLTAHLGGGVGKALTALVTQSRVLGSSCRHIIACLEAPEKNQFLDQIRAQGGEVLVCPDPALLKQRVATADIFHLDWWNHPVTIRTLCALEVVPARLLMWSHVSGLYNPKIPAGLMALARRVVFTSPCSMQLVGADAQTRADGKYAVVSSAGGLEDWPVPERAAADPGSAMSVGYVGTLGFAKLHPDYVDFLAHVQRPELVVTLVGDEVGRETLQSQCVAAGRPGLLHFHGYTTDMGPALARLDVLAYLLNPRHYGTAENALVEAMAMGVVPVVLDNPAEKCIVEHGVTGMVVSTPEEFARAVEWLADHPQERFAMGRRAMQSVRSRFAGRRMVEAFEPIYAGLMWLDRQQVDFRQVFGSEPEAWFLSCQEHAECFLADGSVHLPEEAMARYGLLEKSKGSVFHFHRTFPGSARLGAWSRSLEAVA